MQTTWYKMATLVFSKQIRVFQSGGGWVLGVRGRQVNVQQYLCKTMENSVINWLSTNISEENWSSPQGVNLLKLSLDTFTGEGNLSAIKTMTSV